MKVILMQDVKGVGKKLQTVEVSEGYARNYLIPKKLANICDSKSMSEAKSKTDALAYRKSEDLKKANKDKEILEKRYIEFRHKVGEAGKLFGSVTEKEISEEIEKVFNLKIDKKKISLNTVIKNAGTYTAKIKLYENVVADLKINVISI